MSIFRRLLLAKKTDKQDDDGIILPNGYVRCEYLKNSGKQYIDLQRVIGYYEEYELKYHTTRLGYTYFNWMFGGYAQSASQFRYQDTWIDSGKKNQISLMMGGVNSTKITENVKEVTYIIRTSPYEGFFVNEEKIRDGWEMNVKQNLRPNSRLFGTGGGSAVISGYPVEIYYFIARENGEELSHLVACLDTNGVPCMYDAVRELTLYNNGTGTFGYKRRDNGEIVEPT